MMPLQKPIFFVRHQLPNVFCEYRGLYNEHAQLYVNGAPETRAGRTPQGIINGLIIVRIFLGLSFPHVFGGNPVI
jgi:hypothetical protein